MKEQEFLHEIEALSYHIVFWAIADAVRVPEGSSVGISVKKFQESLVARLIQHNKDKLAQFLVDVNDRTYKVGVPMPVLEGTDGTDGAEECSKCGGTGAYKTRPESPCTVRCECVTYAGLKRGDPRAGLLRYSSLASLEVPSIIDTPQCITCDDTGVITGTAG